MSGVTGRLTLDAVKDVHKILMVVWDDRLQCSIHPIMNWLDGGKKITVLLESGSPRNERGGGTVSKLQEESAQRFGKKP